MEPVSAVPVVLEKPKRKTTFGSLFAAAFIGALLAVWGLYAWGSQIALEQAAPLAP